jgi:hypothetical protein
LLPQHLTADEVVTTQELTLPTETDCTVVPSAVTLVGLVTEVVALSTPTCPLKLKPQQKTSSSVFTAHVVELFPADMERQLVAEPTRVGDD